MSQEDNGEALTLRKKGNTKTRVQITQTGIVEEKVTVRSHTRQILLEHVAKGTTIIQRIQVCLLHVLRLTTFILVYRPKELHGLIGFL